MTRTFHSSRGEVTLRPETSGNYTYTFSSISDANYQRIRIDGPAINQVVHPLASAFFSGSGRSSINSCSGDKVDVDVELRVSLSSAGLGLPLIDHRPIGRRSVGLRSANCGTYRIRDVYLQGLEEKSRAGPSADSSNYRCRRGFFPD